VLDLSGTITAVVGALYKTAFTNAAQHALTIIIIIHEFHHDASIETKLQG